MLIYNNNTHKQSEYGIMYLVQETIRHRNCKPITRYQWMCQTCITYYVNKLSYIVDHVQHLHDKILTSLQGARASRQAGEQASKQVNECVSYLDVESGFQSTTCEYALFTFLNVNITIPGIRTSTHIDF